MDGNIIHQFHLDICQRVTITDTQAHQLENEYYRIVHLVPPSDARAEALAFLGAKINEYRIRQPHLFR